MYPDIQLFVAGQWRDAAGGRKLPVINPATEEVIGQVAHASTADLDEALEAAARGFETWRKVSAFDRAKLMRKAADIFRSRADETARLLTLEQGKPLGEAKMEAMAAADIIDWFAEEARRAYGRVIPARAEGVYQLVVKEPVGPVAAFTPWNFPINQVVRKLSAAVATGCSIIVKAPEETPASPAALIRAFVDAGVPAGVVNLVFGVPAEISEYLIPHPVIRKVTFTGSTPIGKQLAALAGQHMKRVTMELGGHAPAIVFDDADLEPRGEDAGRRQVPQCRPGLRLAHALPGAGEALRAFRREVRRLQQGPEGRRRHGAGRADGPPRARPPRALDRGARRGCEAEGRGGPYGGERIGNKGYFYQPTVLTGVSKEARMMNEEPFGPVAMIAPFKEFDEVVEEANRLPYGLAAYAFTRSAKTANAVAAKVETGMMTINHLGLALPEVPFGGVKDSGYGSEGGSEAIEAYLNTKFVTQAGL
jgi:succinate-semialdehyde dehydrogenase/glutarate-semialdehyde dehydrogenase